MEECFDDEILALKSIYEDELKISDTEKGKELGITLTPATADDEASKYVCLDICIKIPQSYPMSSPQFNITRSRGLSDEYLKELNTKLEDLIEENIGNCMLFNILDSTREHLTDNNIPSDICSICLCGFRKSDDFLKTGCFHYFHRYCLKDYKDHVFKNSVDGILSLIDNTDKLSIDKSKISVPCPVCKTPCEVDSDSINEASPPEDEEVYIDYELLETQRLEFDKMYRLQLDKGGVIDLEKEKNKFLLSNLQQNYDAYIASKESEESNDNEASAAKSASSSIPTSSTQNLHNRGSNRGRWMTRHNFHRGKHHGNYNNHQRFGANLQRSEPRKKLDTLQSSSEAQSIPTNHDNGTLPFAGKERPPPTKHSMIRRRGGYNKTFYDKKTYDPPTTGPQKRGGGFGRRRPYRGSRMNNRRNDFSRSRMTQEKSLEKPDL